MTANSCEPSGKRRARIGGKMALLAEELVEEWLNRQG